jgi:transposase
MVRTCDMAMADALVEAVARGFRSYDDFAAYLDSCERVGDTGTSSHHGGASGLAGGSLR